jgi:PPOX class probable F420-dependent enzyme
VACNLEQLPAWAAEMLAVCRVAHLGLLDEQGRPRVLPVTFVRHADRLWSVVDDKPKRAGGRELARVRWLRRDPRAALTVDHYADDWDRLAWVQVLGGVEIVAVREGAEAVAALAAKYPQYRGAPPPGPLLRLDPERCLHWRARGPAAGSR